ncbi:MAG: hypothetical protein QM619_00940 [Micropruina sp.]|uniref:hypothetical protein n=1 Tax=Micropruina sp. TaxID=2737536 RepID=UPI0039E550EA
MEPVHTTVQEGRADTMRARSLSLARRLLTGSGRASLVAYDLAPLVEAGALRHGMTASGDLVVAGLADDAVPATTWDEGPLRVRLDIVKEAPEWAVRITACAAHLLGTLEWLPAERVGDFVAEAGLDPQLVELATAAGGRLGVIRTVRVLVHDSAGVLPLSFDEVATGLQGWVCRSFPDAGHEWAARDLVGSLSAAQLHGLVHAAATGWDAGVTLSSRAEVTCSHTEGQVFCVDIDRTGLTLMSVVLGRASVHFLAFEEPADAIDELADRLGQLVVSGCGSR